MNRKKKVYQRQILADEIYNSKLIAKFINYIMIDGKKIIAKKIVYSALKEASEILKMDGKVLFEEAIEKIAPVVEVKSRRIGGATYQIPRSVTSKRKMTIALRNLKECTRSRSERGIDQKLKNEILGIFANNASSLQRKEMIQKQAEANKAFTRFRW